MPNATPLAPPITGYRPVKYLGSGGFGDVFRYEHTATHAAAAIKVLRDGVLAAAAAEQLLHEARALGRLSAAGPHPNIVAIQDVGTASGRPYLVMEYCPGGSWAELIAKQGRVSPSKVVSVGIQMAGALYMAHQAGIVHLDIKPGNILIGAHGVPKLADFGIAAVTAEEMARGSAWLSHDYAAPELIESGVADELSDLYALAATLRHALTGSADHKTVAPPQVPESLEWLLRAAMATDRTIRGRSFPDAREFALRLRDIQFELHYERTPVPIEEAGEHTGPRKSLDADPVPATGHRPVKWLSRLQEQAAIADTDLRPADAEPSAPPEGSRRRVLAWAIGVVVVLFATGAILVNTLTSVRQTPTPGESGAVGDAAVPERQPVPVPSVQGKRIDADSIEFTWTYADPRQGDTFRITRAGAPVDRVDKPKWTFDSAPAQEFCIEVMVVREDGRTTTTGGRACA